MRKRILVSYGAIPVKIDPINYITNGSDGISTLSTAKALAVDNDVTVIIWAKTKWEDGFNYGSGTITIIRVDDLFGYYNYISTCQFDVYILAAEIPSFIPDTSINPSSVTFIPAPRVIDIVKERWPFSILIGYKSFDGIGTENQFINEGFKTLFNAHATCIISLSPKKEEKKIMLLPDASVHYFNWDDHIKMIKRIIKLEKYLTEPCPVTEIPEKIKKDLQILLDQIKVEKYGYTFGTVSLRDGGSIISTTRGKRGKYWGKTIGINHKTRTLSGDEMTPNIPILDLLYKKVPGHKIILHAHEFLPEQPDISVLDLPYYFDGTTESIETAKLIGPKDRFVYIKEHGYYAMFENIYEAQKWLDGRSDRKNTME